jgi:hypothetical protein
MPIAVDRDLESHGDLLLEAILLEAILIRPQGGVRSAPRSFR